MVIGQIKTDPTVITKHAPTIPLKKECRWIASDNSDDDVPGLVSTWIHALIELTPEDAERLAKAATVDYEIPADVPAALDVDRSASWKSGPELLKTLNLWPFGIVPAVAGSTMFLRIELGG